MTAGPPPEGDAWGGLKQRCMEVHGSAWKRMEAHGSSWKLVGALRKRQRLLSPLLRWHLVELTNGSKLYTML